MPGTYLDFLEERLERPFEHLVRTEGGGMPVMGYLCGYVPEEVLHAAGFQPVRLFGRAKQIVVADQYLQPYCCSQVKGLLEDFLSGRYPGLSGVVFAHTCDTMQSFFDVFRKNHPSLFVHNINFPSKVTGETALRYTLHELRRFQDVLEALTGKPVGREALRRAIALHNRTRRLLDDLYALHARAPGAVSSATVLKSVLAAMTGDKEDFNARLAAFLEANRNTVEENPEGRIRLMVVGSVLIDPEVYERIDDNGATVVDDDLCTGRRYFSGLVRGDNLACIARRYFERPNCPAKHRSLTARADAVTGAAKRAEADGVLFLHLKFCDPHAFDYPFLRDALEADGVQTQVIEVEQMGGAGGQLETKIQAFVELLQGAR